jgi:hypothetical protein
MAIEAARVVLALALVYAGVGLVFGAAFAAWGAGRIDHAAAGAGWGFRLLILPGAGALWPVMLAKWVRAARGRAP